jgi:hypothetical protein
MRLQELATDHIVVNHESINHYLGIDPIASRVLSLGTGIQAWESNEDTAVSYIHTVNAYLKTAGATPGACTHS